MSAATPWWASEDGVAEIDAHEDPFNVHRSSRAEQAPDAPDWVRLAGDVAVGVVRRLGTLADEGPRGDHAHSPSGDDPVCRNCPVCMVLRAADRSGTDVSDHLADAARHLALAAASFLEALADPPERAAPPSPDDEGATAADGWSPEPGS